MTNNSINTSIPIEVTKGGTEATSFVAYAPVVGGITSTGALQSVASAGNAGEFLVSQGPSALPIWQAGGGGGGGFTSINIQTFDVLGTYTPSANLLYAVVILTGGGGGGGNVSGLIGAVRRGAGGGGGGETRIGSFSAATIGPSQTITIGSGGGSAANGSPSSFGSLMTAKGGSAGQSVTGNTTPGIARGGNSGGGGSGGQISFDSYNGSSEYATLDGVAGGDGSFSYFSYGGFGGFSQINVGIGDNGQPGLRGGGGGAGAIFGTGNSAVGGAGGNGYCVAYEYIG